MAAVAAEPGAAVPTTDEEGAAESGPVGPVHSNTTADLEADVTPEHSPSVAHEGEEVCDTRGHGRPEPAAAGRGKEDISLAAEQEPGCNGPVYRSIVTEHQPPAVFLHSFPAHPPATEAGLSLAEPAEPTTNVTDNEYYQNRAESRSDQPVRGYTELRSGPTDSTDVSLGNGNSSPHRTALNLDRFSTSGGRTQQDATDPPLVTIPQGSAANPAGPRHRRESGSSSPRRRAAEPVKQEEQPRGADAELLAPGSSELLAPGSSELLAPGSEVRVSLDHIMDDALVVSFRVGEKVFSGVLMDLSKRFGPYGIPITVFPRREVRDSPRPPEQLSPGPPPAWSSRAAPLFQEGAPFPPPLLLRDSYQQALPQPPLRRIRRPKRRYRSDPSPAPTSIMSAIRLRPRQVLCDKCKGLVSPGATREVRRGPDARGGGGAEESRRRRGEGGAGGGLNKRLRGDPPPRGGAGGGDKRPPSSSSGQKALRGVAPPSKAPPPPLTRAAALRRSSPPRPPRLRIKPHRYRTDDPPPGPAPLRQLPRPATPRTLSPAPLPSPAPSLPPDMPAPPVAALTKDAPPLLQEKAREKADSSPPPLSRPGGGRRQRAPSPPRAWAEDGRCVCVGDIVWAKISGFPWWPARVLALGAGGRRDARVSWFGSPTTSLLPLGQLAPFLESFSARFHRRRKGPYRRAVAQAAGAAKQLTPEVRALLTQFET